MRGRSIRIPRGSKVAEKGINGSAGLQPIPRVRLAAVVFLAVLNFEPEPVTDFVQSRSELRTTDLEDLRERNPAAAGADQERQNLRFSGVCRIVLHGDLKQILR